MNVVLMHVIVTEFFVHCVFLDKFSYVFILYIFFNLSLFLSLFFKNISCSERLVSLSFFVFFFLISPVSCVKKKLICFDRWRRFFSLRVIAARSCFSDAFPSSC